MLYPFPLTPSHPLSHARMKIRSFPALLATLSIAGATSERPNIILCMTDDQGWGDTSYNGHPVLETPSLDQMAREGVTFTRFYSAAAMCSPTRGSVYTGRNPYRYGITFAMKGRLEAGEITLTQVLREDGYTTGHFGKWHLGTLSRKSGDQKRWGAFQARPERYFCPPWLRHVDQCFVTESKVPTWNPLLDPGKIKRQQNPSPPASPQSYGNDYFTGPGRIEVKNTAGDDSRVLMDRALPFIRSAVARKKPFFAVIWFHTPHSPVVGGPEYLARYQDQPEQARHYYACLTAMDDQMGRLRRELRKLQVSGNTMLWFCSDNGPARQGSPRHVGSTGGLSGFKLSLREGGIRVPGLLVWPNRFAEPRTVSAPCVTSDYFPTILDFLDLPLPPDRVYDGISLRPLLTGKKSLRERPVGFLNRDGNEMAWMEDQYKMVTSGKKTALFDIPADPAEKRDLSKALPGQLSRMQAASRKWRRAVLEEMESLPD